jgi:hypothetical protein
MSTFRDEDIRERVQAAKKALDTYKEDMTDEPYMVLNNYLDLITAMITTKIQEQDKEIRFPINW